MALKETVERLRNARADVNEPPDLVAVWQSDVSRLFDQIADWLKPYMENGGISLDRQSKSVHEESTGSYDIDHLDIDVGNETVRLEPKGAVVIGARGRIDMSRLGSGDPVLLVLTGTAEQSVWNIVDRSIRTRLLPLTKETFEAALERLLEDYGMRSEYAM